MSLQKFTIMTTSESHQDEISTNILINPNHIVSVKPIKIIAKEQNVIDGFWIRLSNGKKYKATRIPAALSELFNEKLPQIKINNEAGQTVNLQ